VQEFERAHWDEAAALFERAHRMSPSARTLRGMGLTAYEARRYVDAIGFLKAALSDDRHALAPDQRREVLSILDLVQGFVVHLELSTVPASARISLNGRQVERDARGELLLDPGNLELEVSAEGYESTLRHIRVAAGERQALSITLARASEAASASTPQSAVAPVVAKSTSNSTISVLKWSFGTAAVLALGAGGVFLAIQKSQASRFNDSCVRGMLTPECRELERAASAGGTWYTASIIGLSAGAAFAVTSAALFVLDGKNADRSRPPTGAARSCDVRLLEPGVSCAFRF
jgi:tetratricopeptide (TPR) repeat protein